MALRVPDPGVVEAVKEVKEAFQAPRNVRKRRKYGRFPELIDLKNTKNAVFYLKVLNKNNPNTLLRNTLILKFVIT